MDITLPHNDDSRMSPAAAAEVAAQMASRKDGFDPGHGKHVLFFGDPMCSWCWGFAPTLRRISGQLQGRADLHIIMGGLRPGTRTPWDAKMRESILEHWRHVEQASGQPFDYARFDDENFVYDTEPACRAAVAVRAIAPERAAAYYESLQRAFYAEGRDVTNPVTLTDLAELQNIGRTEFLNFFNSSHARTLVERDFARTRAFGVSGFPSVICAEDGQYAVLSQGYRPYDVLQPLLERWLAAQA